MKYAYKRTCDTQSKLHTWVTIIFIYWSTELLVTDWSYHIISNCTVSHHTRPHIHIQMSNLVSIIVACKGFVQICYWRWGNFGRGRKQWYLWNLKSWNWELIELIINENGGGTLMLQTRNSHVWGYVERWAFAVSTKLTGFPWFLWMEPASATIWCIDSFLTIASLICSK